MNRIGIFEFEDVEALLLWIKLFKIWNIETDARLESERWVLYAGCNEGTKEHLNVACSVAWARLHPKRNILKSILRL